LVDCHEVVNNAIDRDRATREDAEALKLNFFDFFREGNFYASGFNSFNM
jgi:hypothetical protein